MMNITIDTPRFWWRASGQDLRPWVLDNPHIEGRWPDHSPHRWDLIARTVAQIGNALAEHDWRPEPGVERQGTVTLTEYPEGLTRDEQKIVKSWFSLGQAVRFDPWFHPIHNGRHRLWNTLPHLGNAMIPVCGLTLELANPAQVEFMGDGWAKTYENNLAELDKLDWLDMEDLVNRSFRRSLGLAAGGQFPSMN